MPLSSVPARAEGGFHVVVEAPRGATLKLKHDPALDVMIGHRPLPLGFAYPYDWGFVPGTKASDGDPVDALVYWDVSSYPGVVVRCRALGVLALEQDAKRGGRERNDRILALPLVHSRGAALRTHADLDRRVLEEIEHFFTSSVFFEPKNPRILGWQGPEDAERLLAGS
ncbi:inorganic diphosphatase [Anaeromyxobacter terrae]|uniref:inorganic diphosphatase n=1 Tax=Anaeromyxobacter terrae TaxID=2925406 RepID=UPI001F59AAD3|nr:inorganic diphosphatase [Anaeromyxobacter sp. SG22]